MLSVFKKASGWLIPATGLTLVVVLLIFVFLRAPKNQRLDRKEQIKIIDSLLNELQQDRKEALEAANDFSNFDSMMDLRMSEFMELIEENNNELNYLRQNMDKKIKDVNKLIEEKESIKGPQLLPELRNLETL